MPVILAGLALVIALVGLLEASVALHTTRHARFASPSAVKDLADEVARMQRANGEWYESFDRRLQGLAGSMRGRGSKKDELIEQLISQGALARPETNHAPALSQWERDFRQRNGDG